MLGVEAQSEDVDVQPISCTPESAVDLIGYLPACREHPKVQPRDGVGGRKKLPFQLVFIKLAVLPVAFAFDGDDRRAGARGGHVTTGLGAGVRKKELDASEPRDQALDESFKATAASRCQLAKAVTKEFVVWFQDHWPRRRLAARGRRGYL